MTVPTTTTRTVTQPEDLTHELATPDQPALRHRRRPGMTALLVLLLAAIVAYYVTRGSAFAVFLLDTALLACIGALALGLLMGTAGQVSIGNSAFLAAGGFTAVWASRTGFPFLLSVAFAAVVCGVVGAVVGLPALRIRGIYLALATLAAFFVVLFVANEYQSNTVGAGAFLLEPVFGGTAAERNQNWAWLLLAVVAVCLVLTTWMRTGRSGRAWRMIRDHEVAAPMMGIPVARYKLMAFIISSAMIGMQGALAAHFIGSLTADTFTLNLAVSYIAMILIGGADSQAGPLIGAFLVTTMPTFVPDLVEAASGSNASADSAAYSQIAYGALLILFIVYSPRGINGWFVDLSRFVRRRLAARKQHASGEFDVVA